MDNNARPNFKLQAQTQLSIHNPEVLEFSDDMLERTINNRARELEEIWVHKQSQNNQGV